MSGANGKRIVYRMLPALVLALALPSIVTSEQLPIKTYTTADGLPVDVVMRIKRDSHGFLWFCTRDGLSKFDGYQFTSYGKAQGLPHPMINDLIESSDGTYWVATNGGGVCRFNPAARAPANSASRFTVYSLGDHSASNRVNRLCEDREGRIWAGSDKGLFIFDKTQDRFIAAVPDAGEVYSLFVDREGGLWIGAGNQLWRRRPDGQLARYSFQVVIDMGRIFSLLEDDQGKLWVGSHFAGVFELDPQLLPLEDSVLQVGKSKGLLNHFTTADGIVIAAVIDLHQSPDGHLWMVTSPNTATFVGGGLLEFDGQRFRRYGKAQGLTSNLLQCLAEDSQGNFWLGSIDGAMKIARNGFATYGEQNGLLRGPGAMFENRSGELCVITEAGMAVNRFADGRFIATHFNVPKALQNSKLWGNHQITFQDRAGDWWVPTAKGLMRFPAVARVEQLARARPKAHYLLGGDRDWFDIFRMFEDARGDIWVGLASMAKSALVKWERATEKFHHYTEAEGVPPLSPPTSFCEDAHGNLWIGLYGGGLLRYGAGRFTLFGTADGLPSGLINHLYLDRSRRLWIASSSDGAACMDDPGTERPTVIKFTVANGLSSNVVYSITEDEWGRIYLGMPSSVDRLNPATGNIKRYTAADGLPKGGAQIGLRDASGALWFGGSYDIVRLIPLPDEQPPPPPVRITGLRVTGQTQTVADLGETEIRGLELEPSRNHLQIDFAGLAFGAGETLRYQYKLEGADADWQPFTTQRTVNYANLAPRAYRFLVRAMNTDGQFSVLPAMIEFKVLAPIWQQWWFLSLTAALLTAAAYAFYRYRLARLLELERVRTHIAADLHDDIGANLTRIAILSEVAHARLHDETAGLESPLSAIARISRESVASMSDIVWAINPKRDSVLDVIQRMRRFAGEVFAGRQIEFEFRAPEREDGLPLGANVRRNLFLIFKEAVNNAARHSGCSSVEIYFGVEGSRIVLQVKDDGRGFDTDAPSEGQGLLSMKRRAQSLGGELQLTSRKSVGTQVTLKVPLRSR